MNFNLGNQILSTFKFTDQSLSNQTANWKTYTNAKYGFLFQYPSTSTVNNNNYTGYLATFIINKISAVDPSVDITFYIGSSDESLAYDKNDKNYSVLTTNVAGLSAIRVSMPMGQNPPQELVFFTKEGKYYHFQFVWDGKSQKDKETFDQILSTFKFLD